MTRRNAQPESLLQCQTARFLMDRLGPPSMWIGGAAGLWLPIGIRMKAKAHGILNRGWSDVSIMTTHGLHVIELKEPNAPKNALSKEQIEFRDLCAMSNTPWAECRSLQAVEATLIGWEVELRPDPFAPK